jgi:RNA polymerase sigma factor (sigma-70 family)
VEIAILAKFKNNNFRARRIALGFSTVAAFCRAYDFKQATIGTYENFRNYPKSEKMIDKLEKIFKCPIEDLFPPEYKKAVDMKLGRKVIERTVETDALLPGVLEIGLLPSPVDLYEAVEDAENIKTAMERLTHRQREVLKMRFGLDGSGEFTLDEIADKFMVSPERIRQIEGKAIRRMKHPDLLKYYRKDRDMTYSKIEGEEKTFSLTCNQANCSFTEHFEDNDQAYTRGWRMEGEDHICPSCMDVRNARKKYKKITVDGFKIITNVNLDKQEMNEHANMMFKEMNQLIWKYFPQARIYGQWKVRKLGEED